MRLSALLLALCCALAAAASPTPPGTADELLTELETADRGLKSLTAKILYDRTFEIAGDRQIRTGVLYFVGGEEKKPRAFAIRFDTLIVGQSRRDEEKWFVFDGQWLLEKTPAQKRFTKRQVVGPGESFDPLRIGEGPFPIPIGQKKSEILDRYEAALLPPEDGLSEPKLAEFVAGSSQLKLTPKDPKDDFREIRLWYRRGPESEGRWLPRMSKTLSRDGDESVVQLIQVRANTPVPAEATDTSTPEGWDGTVQPYREKPTPPPTPANHDQAP